jgi:hypothetical protein
MRQHYRRNKQFGDHLVRFNTIMQRSTTMTEQEKQEMELASSTTEDEARKLLHI